MPISPSRSPARSFWKEKLGSKRKPKSEPLAWAQTSQRCFSVFWLLITLVIWTVAGRSLHCSHHMISTPFSLFSPDVGVFPSSTRAQTTTSRLPSWALVVFCRRAHTPISRDNFDDKESAGLPAIDGPEEYPRLLPTNRLILVE